MNLFILLIALTGNVYSAWYVGGEGIEPKLIGGGGDSGEAETKQRISVQRLVIPTNPPVHNPNITLYHPSSRCPTQPRNISIGVNQNSIEVVNLRGQLEAQNIDIVSKRNCFERLMQSISNWCGSRARTQPPTPIRQLTPPQLFRTDSIYPGRSQENF